MCGLVEAGTAKLGSTYRRIEPPYDRTTLGLYGSPDRVRAAPDAMESAKSRSLRDG